MSASSVSIAPQNRVRPANRCMRDVYGTAVGCDNPPMGDPDVFDELLASLGGFYRSWLIYLGIELGLFDAPPRRGRGHDARRAGDDHRHARGGRSTSGHGPLTPISWPTEDGRLRVDPDLAGTLLDRARTDYLGGQFVHGVVATLDWDRMLDFFRTGTPVRDRPDRYRTAIERLTQQDIAVFFQEALAALPQAVADLSNGGRVVDIHCGGGRWLIAMARRFPKLELVGVEFEADSVARAPPARRGGRARRSDQHRPGGGRTLPGRGRSTWPTSSTPPPAARRGRRAAQGVGCARPERTADRPRLAAAVRPGGIPVAPWRLIAGVQLDELYQGTSLATRDQFRSWFADAGLPEPT